VDKYNLLNISLLDFLDVFSQWRRVFWRETF
jgi:hypothetical protein